MEFNWEEFMNKDNNIAVHCKTEEEAIDFCKKMDKLGMRWCSGGSYINNNNWYEYKEETCYTNKGSNKGEFSPKYWYEEHDYKILEWSDYIIKKPFDYLEYGYVVEFNSGRLGMYMPSQNGDCFDLNGIYNCIYINDFDDKENLKYENKSNNFNNVIKIYGYSEYGCNSRVLSLNGRPLIWERPEEVRKMTVSDICKELGYKVEIVEG